MYSYGSPHTAAQKQDDQHERTFSSYVRIQVVVQKTYLGRWTIGRSGERGSGISVLPARYDDDDIYIYIYIPIVEGRIFGFIHFPRVLVLWEMQSVWSSIRTRIVVSISYDDNHYTTGTNIYLYIYIYSRAD